MTSQYLTVTVTFATEYLYNLPLLAPPLGMEALSKLLKRLGQLGNTLLLPKNLVRNIGVRKECMLNDAWPQNLAERECIWKGCQA